MLLAEESLYIWLIPSVIAPSDEANSRAVAQVKGDNNTEEEKTDPTLQRLLRHLASNDFCQEVVKNVGLASAYLLL